jgi:hypothetical protein
MMRVSSQPLSAAARGPRRVNGLLVLLVLVAVGMGVTSVVFKWMSPQLRERMQRARADAPKSGEPRVAHWLEFGRGFVHQRLVQLHFSPDEPWLVTHTVGADRDAGEVEVWGVDLTDLPVEATAQDGMSVVVNLPEPRVLARGPFGEQRKRNDKARNVPHFASAEVAPDPRERARTVVLWALDRLVTALVRDIDGASLEVRFPTDPPPPTNVPADPDDASTDG